MKLGPILLINALLVGGGIFAYDMIKGSSTTSESTTFTANLPADDDNGIDDYIPEPALKGIGDEVVRDKVKSLEAEVASMKALLAKLQVKGGSGVASEGTSEGGAMGAIELPAVAEDEEDPQFDDASMRSFRAMLSKAQSLEREERMIEGMKRQFERLGVQLNADQEKAVIKAAMDYRTKQRNMWRTLPRGNDEENRTKRREAMESLQEEWSKTVYSLAPAAEAEKIVGGMNRGFGFSPRGVDGGGRNNRRGR